MPEPIVNPESAAPAAAPTPAPAAAPKAEDIATSFLAALETRTQRVEKSVAKSFSEQYWLSHTPLAGNDRQYRTPYQATRNFNPRSPCGERPNAEYALAECLGISIHAPLAGSDVHSKCCLAQRHFISIHAPLAGSDGHGHGAAELEVDFNPRSPCGERRKISVG